MDKTTIYLPRDLHNSLIDEARLRGKPQAVLIREALASYLAHSERKLPSSIGMFSDTSLQSYEADEWLEKNWEID